VWGVFEESAAFLKKRSKNFYPLVCATGVGLGSKGKSFLVLFFKKELLP
jgi:hypothetical protein